MSLPGAILDREMSKFVQSPTRANDNAVEVLSYPGNLDGSPGFASYECVNQYGESLAVASGSEEVIASYSVPAGNKFYLSQVQASGNNIGTYRVTLDGTTVAKSRTWFNGSMEAVFKFVTGIRDLGLVVQENVLIEVLAIHNRPSVGDFEGRILGVLTDE